MITIEATKDNKKISEICLTDPHDGGSRERNAQETDEWKTKVISEHGENVKFATYFD